MPVSFWITTGLVFITVSGISISAAAKFYRKEGKLAWEKQRRLNTLTLLRGALPLCAVATMVIMLCIKSIFYQ